MMEEALIVAQQHVAESMLKDGVDGILGNCLHGMVHQNIVGTIKTFK